MRNLILIAALAVNFSSPPVLAHEGHNHDAPTTLKAPKGGVIKALDQARVEVVSKGKDIKIFVYDSEMKPAPTSEFQITANAEIPRTKKEEAVKLTSKDNFFEGSFDAKGAHRYTLKLAVTDSKTSRTDNLTFTIEPRK